MGFFNSLFAQLHAFVFSIGLFIHFLLSPFGGTTPVYVQQNPPAASTTSTAPASTHTATSTATTSPAQKKAVAKITAAASLPTQKQTATKVTPPATTTVTTTPVTQDTARVSASGTMVEQLNATARGSLVNILCTTVTGGSFNPISGSGVLIDSRGIILTNAHVAQYLLLKDFPFKNNITCVVRMGSPAQPLYTAELLYVPTAWVSANAVQLASQHAQGTGEHDYALLRINGTVSSSVPMPASFPTLQTTADTPEVGAPALLAAYPAQLLSGEAIQKNLYSSSAVATVSDLYSFDDLAHADLVSVSGSVVSQTGSSGGALVGVGSGKLLGIIATQSSGTTTADRRLNAITIAYINRSLNSAGYGSLNALLTGDLAQKALDFQTNVAPGEIAQLEAVLKKISY
jgi:hypothetical protein